MTFRSVMQSGCARSKAAAPSSTLPFPLKLDRNGMPELVKLRMGPNAGSCVFVEKALLCAASPFFRAAFSTKSMFAEAVSGTMYLPEDDASTIEGFLIWLHDEAGFIHEYGPDWVAGDPPHLLRLYAFAERVQCAGLLKALDALIAEAWPEDTPPVTPELAAFAVDNLSPASTLYQLLVISFADAYVRRPDERWHEPDRILDGIYFARFGGRPDVFPADFVADADAAIHRPVVRGETSGDLIWELLDDVLPARAETAARRGKGMERG